ncbi:MAG TPA: DUF4276 family protein [Candidatus Sumerlaeota bacterium]|nr:DUF4276 family protein [Candidatus Sumerlaeota bacterium]HPS02742.1 DUF4276 family protein [Candidatus Sumerlaeota bacterium]
MARSLTLALLREGTTDSLFLSDLLRRLMDEICSDMDLLRYPIEVGPVRDLFRESGMKRSLDSFKELAIQEKAKDSFDLLFVHADGDGNPDAIRQYQIQPIAEHIRQLSSKPDVETIAVVPVREMEAWTLVDGDALRRVFSCSLSDEQMGLPVPFRKAESLADPKACFEKCFEVIMGRRKNSRGKLRAHDFLELIGQEVSFERLRHLSAFQQLENDLRTALTQLGILKEIA